MEVTSSNKDMLKYRYILNTDGKLFLMTPENISEFIGKRVKLRSPMTCKNPRICNKCAGEFYKKMGIENAGMLNCTLSGKLTNISMGKFHDATIYFDDIDINNFLITV